MNSFTRIFVVGAALCAAGLSSAQSLGQASFFNAVIFGNVNAQSGESDGAMAVRGNWTTQNNYQISIKGSAPAPIVGGATNLGLYLKGSMSAGQNPGTTQVNSGRNAYVGGTISGGLLMNGGTSFGNSGLVTDTFFANQQAFSLTQSAFLASLGGNAVDTSNPNNYKVTISNTGGLNVFAIDAALLSGGKTLDVIGGNGQETLVFNVTGGTVNWGTNYNGNVRRALWNFHQATTLNVSERLLRGSVLAVGATVNQSQNIDGTLVASALNVFNGAELHMETFEGNAPVPEPMTMGVLALGALAAARRRRSA